MAVVHEQANELCPRLHQAQLARSLPDAAVSIHFVPEALGDGNRCLPQDARHKKECREAQSKPKSAKMDSL